MPEISRFFGIVINMYFDDHAPPHFHARYNDDNAVISIDTLEVIEGSMRSKELALVRKWAAKHQAELLEAWNKAEEYQAPGKIEPLN
jgi:hypothetical protein